MRFLTWIWGFLSIFRESDAEKNLRYRQSKAASAQALLDFRRNKALLIEARKEKERLYREADAKVDAVVEDVLSDKDNATEFESDWHPYPYRTRGDAA